MMSDKNPTIDLDFSLDKTIRTSFPDEIKSVKDFIERLEKDVKKEFEQLEGDLFFYRGQINKKWQLKPILFREDQYYKQEHQIIRDLIARQAKDFSNDRIMFDYLVRAQHYGLPTRLLDVTRNPLIALYFACSDDNELEENGKIFIFKQKKEEIEYFDSETVSLLSNLATLSDKEKLEIKAEDTLQKLHNAVRHEKSGFEDRNNETSKILKKPCFVMPRQNNDRIIAQQGAFILLGLRDENKDEINSGVEVFKSYEISKYYKEGILKELDILGIHEHSVYPDLEHCAKYLQGKLDRLNNFKRLKIDADKDNPRAQFLYSLRCEQGYRVKQDDGEAEQYFKKALDQNYAEAQFYRGLMYYAGNGTKQDFEEAKKYFELASEQNHAEAQFYLGLMYNNGEGVKQDSTEAYKNFKKAALQNHAEAQYNLGVMYEYGNGVKQDYLKAKKYFEKAAKQGHAGAQNNLGFMYYQGNGVKQDFKEACEYWEKAAEQGHVKAQFSLGIMYVRGQGVSRDYKKARKYLEEVAKQGDKDAKDALKALDAFEKQDDPNNPDDPEKK